MTLKMEQAGFHARIAEISKEKDVNPRLVMPVRLWIQNELQKVLREINGTNGYYFDLSGNAGEAKDKVIRGKYIIDANEDLVDGLTLPLLAILEKDEQKENTPSINTADSPDLSYDYDLWILGVADKALEGFGYAFDEAHFLLADVKRRLAFLQHEHIEADFYFSQSQDSGVVEDMRFDPGVVRPPKIKSGLAYFVLEVRFRVSEQPLNPYITITT